MTEISEGSSENASLVRVAWLAGRDTFASMGHTLTPLAIGLMGELVEIALVIPRDADRREVPSPPVAVLPGPGGWFRPTKSSVTALAVEVSKRQIDVLHGLDAAQGQLAGQLARLSSLPYVMSCHTFRGVESLRHCDPRPDAILASGDVIAALLQDVLQLQDDRIQIVRPGVHPYGQITCFTDASRIPSILVDGRCGDFGAIEVTIQAFAELHRRQIDCSCFLVGAGRLEKRLRKLGESLHVRHELTFVDLTTASQLPEILAGADIYIAPKASEGVNLWALLAMASGTVVLAADSPEDFFIDGRTVRIFEMGNAGDLTEKLTKLLADHASGRQLARQAVEHIRTAHSPAGMVDRVTGVYRRLLSPVNA